MADLLNNKIAGMNKGITGQATDGINYKKNPNTSLMYRLLWKYKEVSFSAFPLVTASHLSICYWVLLKANTVLEEIFMTSKGNFCVFNTRNHTVSGF